MIVFGSALGIMASLFIFFLRVVIMDWVINEEKWAFYSGFEYASGRRESGYSAEAERAWEDIKEQLHPFS